MPMSFRSLSTFALALVAAAYALPGETRGISIDDAINCAQQPTSQSSTIALPAYGSGTANSADSGVTGLYVWACNFNPAEDDSVSPSEFFTLSGTNNVFNTWVDLQGQNPSYVFANNPLSTLSGTGNVTLVAQVNAYQLTGLLDGYQGNLTNVAGDYEVQFDYENYGGGNTSCAQNSASFTWYGVTYQFAGSGGLLLCNLPNDFLFNSNGQLLGYLNDSGSLISGLEGSGWVQKSASAPEPGTLALLAFAGMPLLLLSARRRRAATARRAA
jgi:hypothetical protein